MNLIQTKFSIERVKKSRLPEVNFDQLRFGREFSDHMFFAEFIDDTWQPAVIKPFQSLSLSPAACVFHYGQAIFEGLKAYKANDGRVLLFRPRENFVRLNRSAERMCMAKVPEEYFIDGIKELVKTDMAWVPQAKDKSLYIRPFLIADEAFIGVKPSDTYQFIIITSPTSAYYSGAIKVKIESNYSRAAHGGIGAAKAAANYAASLYPAMIANKEGYNQLIWTDSRTHEYIEESGTMNLIMISEGKLITPSLTTETILPGITRDSIIHLAKNWGVTVEERKISVNELIDGIKSNTITELFGVGTAATITPISAVSYANIDYTLSDYTQWEFSNKAKAFLEALKRGELEDEFGWIEEVSGQ